MWHVHLALLGQMSFEKCLTSFLRLIHNFRPFSVREAPPNRATFVSYTFVQWKVCLPEGLASHIRTVKESQAFLKGNLPYSCLENPMDGGAWWAAVHGVARSRTRLNDFTLFFHFHALEKEMATHSSVLAWRIPGTGEPGGLPSMGSHRVGYD